VSHPFESIDNFIEFEPFTLWCQHDDAIFARFIDALSNSERHFNPTFNELRLSSEDKLFLINKSFNVLTVCVSKVTL